MLVSKHFPTAMSVAWDPQNVKKVQIQLFFGFLLLIFSSLGFLLPISLLLLLSSSLQTAENGISCCLDGFQGKLKQTPQKISGEVENKLLKRFQGKVKQLFDNTWENKNNKHMWDMWKIF